MNLSKRFQLVNTGKLVVYMCILIYSLLMSLWMDGLIHWSIWTVFLPLWFWKMLITFGSVVGIGVWCCKPESRYERGAFVQFRAMIISTALHLLLILFEVLACIKLETGSNRFPWTLVFAPLMFSSLLSIVLCLWAIKNDRGFEMELICSVNCLQFVFIAIKLDGFVSWNWTLVLIPLWIALCVAFIFMLYAVVVAAILMKAGDAQPENRHVTVHTALTYVFIVIPLIVYANYVSGIYRIMLLLTSTNNSLLVPALPVPNMKLLTTLVPFIPNACHCDIPILLVENMEGMTQLYYTLVGIPLYIALVTLILSSFSSRPSNIWWFGLRKDFCQFIIVDACPCLQEYGNISYKVQFNDSAQRDSSVSQQQPINNRPISDQPIRHQPISDQPISEQTVTERSASSSPARSSNKGSTKDALVTPVVFIEMPD